MLKQITWKWIKKKRKIKIRFIDLCVIKTHFMLRNHCVWCSKKRRIYYQNPVPNYNLYSCMLDWKYTLKCHSTSNFLLTWETKRFYNCASFNKFTQSNFLVIDPPFLRSLIDTQFRNSVAQVRFRIPN